MSIISANVESLFKFTINNELRYPKFIHHLLERELTMTAFTSINTLSKKVLVLQLSSKKAF